MITRLIFAAGLASTLCYGQGNISTLYTNSGCCNGALALDPQGNVYIFGSTPQPAILRVSPNGTATTIAGGNPFGYSGDGGPATKAALSGSQPFSGLVVDASGNVYFSDVGNNVVRMINASTGIITTVAGTGTRGYLGDGGPATKALLNTPAGLALDSAGNLYIADDVSNRVRMVNTAGIISTVAGDGNSIFERDGVAATKTSVGNPLGVAFDSAGNLYIAETNRVRKVDTTGMITTVAGLTTFPNFGFSGDGGPATSAQLFGPLGMAFDSSGNLYIADNQNLRIRKVDTTGIITTWAGVYGPVSTPLGDGGPATKAYIGNPLGLVFDAAGNMYVSTAMNSVRRISAAPAFACTNTAAPTITSVDSASAYGGYAYFASGSWLEIKGTNLADPADPRLKAASNPGQWTSADFSGANAPTTLDGISVSINGKAAYVWYLSPGQINVQAPEDTATGNVSITVTNCKPTSAGFTFARRALAPGLLAPSSFNIGGTQYMVATFASDGAYVLNTSTGAGFGLTSRPAKPGDTIIAYGIGFGDVTPSILPGVIAGQSNSLVSPVTFAFGSTNAALSYSGLAGNFVGLYEFYITVPAGLANGDYQINVTQGGTKVPQTLFLTVHN